MFILSVSCPAKNKEINTHKKKNNLCHIWTRHIFTSTVNVYKYIYNRHIYIDIYIVKYPNILYVCVQVRFVLRSSVFCAVWLSDKPYIRQSQRLHSCATGHRNDLQGPARAPPLREALADCCLCSCGGSSHISCLTASSSASPSLAPPGLSRPQPTII